jgi:uncharacterized protein
VSAGPVPAAERSAALDVLRGAALFGVLLVNMEFHRGPALYLEGSGVEEDRGPADDVVAWAISWLGAGKAYTVLAFLFGYGIAVMLRRAAQAGVPPVPRLLRRLAALFALGLLHAVLLFFGDVLIAYAVAGLALLALRDRPDRSLVRWAVALIVLPAVLIGLLTAGGGELSPVDAQLTVSDAEDATAAYNREPGGGRRPAAARPRLRDEHPPARPAREHRLLVLGLLAGRHRLLERPAGAHRARWRRVAVAGLGLGLPLNVLVAVTYEGGLPADPLAAGVLAAVTFTVPLVLAAGYVAGLVLLLERDGPRRALTGLLAPLGRVSLTAYLAQSLVAALVFTAYGLGLYGDVGPAAGLALTVAIFATEVAAARAYVRRRRLGPAEWLIRRVTYAGAPRSFSAR